MQRNANGLCRAHSGADVRAARAYLDMSQNEFAGYLGITGPTVARMEKQARIRLKYMYMVQKAVADWDYANEQREAALVSRTPQVVQPVPVAVPPTKVYTDEQKAAIAETYAEMGEPVPEEFR